MYSCIAMIIVIIEKNQGGLCYMQGRYFVVQQYNWYGMDVKGLLRVLTRSYLCGSISFSDIHLPHLLTWMIL